jgi:hypothetical protein
VARLSANRLVMRLGSIAPAHLMNPDVRRRGRGQGLYQRGYGSLLGLARISARAQHLSPDPANPRGWPMPKELKTAEQLSDMIGLALGVHEVHVRVRKDHAYGWQPTVVSSPGDSIGYQRRVEEIARRLRLQFDLRE